MPRLKSVPLLLVSVVMTVLLLTLPAGGYAQTEQPVGTPAEPLWQDAPPDSVAKPALEGAAPNPFPIISYRPEREDRSAADAALAINLVYGSTQNFGQLGLPQPTADIIGFVDGATKTTSLTYQLNGGPSQPLSLGPDTRRLFEPGSFIIELAFADLVPGANTVTITAVDGAEQVTEDVTINYTAGATWPANYSIDWSTVTSILDVAQPVTGSFEIAGDEVRTVNPGYDRLLAIGDLSWNDYEVTVPVTVESLNTAGWGFPSNGAGVGFISGWQGHYLLDDEQPAVGWGRALNAISWFRWSDKGTSGFQMLGYRAAPLTSADQQLELNKTYMFKLSVQSNDGQPNTYRLKHWLQGSPEPANWTMEGQGRPGEPKTGSVVLVAHQAMVRFGDVAVRSTVSVPSHTITVEPSSNGTVIVEPAQESYPYGERVSIRAEAAPGYVLANWTGDLSGNDNPIEFDITQDMTVSAIFEPGPPPALTVTVDGNGDVLISPAKANYQYGELVKLTPVPKPGYLFAGWGGDLSGADYPGTIIMNGNRSVIAYFAPANPESPISDDFNSCLLDTTLWEFQNPLGDGTVSLNGTQLLLTAPAGVSHDIWLNGNNSVRVMQPTQNENFEIVAKFDSEVTQRFQMQGFLIEQDADNFLRLEVYHDGQSVVVYGAKFVDGSPELIIDRRRLDDTPPWMRVTHSGDTWSFSYSYDGSEWESAGSFTHELNVTSSGVFAGNESTSGNAPAHQAIVDYYFNTASPIAPEDGGAIGVLVNEVGQGTVTRNPDEEPYECGQTVELTAIPADGWRFDNWSGAVTGTDATVDITIVGPMSVTATFVEVAIVPQIKLYLPAVLSSE